MLTQDEVKRLLEYDPETGVLTWKINISNRKIGDVAGYSYTLKRQGESYKRYIKIGIKDKKYLAHRIIWLYVNGSFPENEIDHIDGDGTNNKIENLREVEHKENSKNRRKPSNNISGMVGIAYVYNKWRVTIRVNGKRIHLGYFKDIQDAIISRKEAELKYGFHPNHGTDRPL